jgi:Tol biopolymer transport system component
MRTTRFLSLVLALGLGAAIAAAADRAQERRLQEAIHLMETKGDYPAAIKAFEELAKGSERALAARALLYLGLCYEKLGKAEAQKAYERLLREFADQSEVVPQARERLAALERAAGSAKGAETVVRRVWEGAMDDTGAPSPDGKYLSYVDWDTGDLAIRELATGKNRRLTNKGSWKDSQEYAEGSIWSPDGQQVAYSWYNKEEKYDLRTIRLDGSAPRVLYANEEVVWTQAADWSPDGKRILALFSRKDQTNQIVLVSVADGSVRILKSLDWRYPQKISLSPDGRYLVYDFPPKEDSPKRDIFLLATDGSREICLVEHPANDFVLGWAPDGKRVLFASDRRGSVDAWAIPVADGKPMGAPELVRLDIGHGFQPLGFTRNGSFYYGMSGGRTQNVFLAELDPQTGKVSAPPKSITDRFAAENSWPAWSRDGRYLSFRSTHPGRRTVLRILSLNTGKEREFPMEPGLVALQWSPDGRSILGSGYGQKGQRGLFKIDTQTGDVAPLLLFESEDFQPASGRLSPDGKAIYYTVKGSSFHVRQLETGVDRELYAAPMATPRSLRLRTLDLSPDGRHLAFVSVDDSTDSTRLSVLPTAGGKPRELLSLKQPETISLGAPTASLAWTPDGRYLLFFKRRQADNNVQASNPELWRIRAEGGQPEKLLEVPMRRVQSLCVHPDGRRIAFAGGGGQQKSEVWVMENFLPAVPKEATSGSPR